MLHELLLALSGHYGGAFKHTNEGIKVVPNLPFMPSSEVAVLNQLCKLGTYYKDFRDFIQHYGSGILSHQTPGTEDLYGLYVKCVCQGLDSVLEDYRTSLQELEQEVLQDAHLPVSHFSYKLQKSVLHYPRKKYIEENRREETALSNANPRLERVSYGVVQENC
ncbi:gamma-tubulin complex component [Elysia marginata]|uniref:Gamma-tubulin complex component n=1 Tax=Elysia marginata TaxID=1093978 RepID=A0AAV4FNH4_9GAST|nr:gamma-tubulin complex component [Elysia marginata]